MKLRDRVAPEGLIAIAKSSNKVAMIEVNCETDFVAKTESFVSLAEKVANTCFMHGFAQSVRNTKRVSFIGSDTLIRINHIHWFRQ